MSSKIHRVAITGDGAIGKTCLLSVYCSGVFPSNSAPTVFESRQHEYVVNGHPISIHIQDTAGQENYTQLRLMAYRDLSVGLIGFSIVDPVSLDNVYDAWWPEFVNQTLIGTPFILVGTKADLRNDPTSIARLRQDEQAPVTQAQGKNMANRLKAFRYVECSALKNFNLDAIFEAVGEAIYNPKKKHKRKFCIIL
ncbi:P-loop containing nucleoside triphosphate hydrolase [Lipomyces arxii]|uniref:P-loop containing nucleoside triphosphate hydrolase n=1 Tax=Lipomyces arxii TaxID=56418 RepID=UPI0034CF0488